MNILVDKLKKNAIPFKVVGNTIIITSSELKSDEEITINPKFKEKQMAVVKELYEFREDILTDKLHLLNNQYVRDLNEPHILKIQKTIRDLHEQLFPIAKFFEDSWKSKDNWYKWKK